MSEGAGEGGAGPVKRLVARLLAMPLRRLALGAGMLALAVSGLFGGLKTVTEPKLDEVAVGAVNRGQPWNVIVRGARVVDRAPLAARRAGDRWLAVRVNVEITSDRSRRDLNDILQVTGVDGLLGKEPAAVFLLRDNAWAELLHPGLAEDLIFFWEQEAGAALPVAVEVRIAGKKQRADSLTGRRDWLDLAPRARVRLPVEDKRQPS
jgi:hypothetical protein